MSGEDRAQAPRAVRPVAAVSPPLPPPNSAAWRSSDPRRGPDTADRGRASLAVAGPGPAALGMAPHGTPPGSGRQTGAHSRDRLTTCGTWL